ncbi:MAG: TetR/AcrR family transcriptional regulator [Abditibacteriota bacterium]|nr:TetR/AcrR family transcriptional regulator [Abditibacteriota bacterium]
MNKSGEDNRRVRNTRKQLREALLALMRDKPIHEITTKELTERADLNRGTFYLHYTDIYDLLHNVEDDLIEQFDQVLNDRVPADAEETILYLTKIISFIRDNLPVYGVLFSLNNNDLHLLQRLRQHVRDKCSFFWLSRAPGVTQERMELYTSFIVMGFIGVLHTWIGSGMKEKPEEIARFIMDMVLSSESCGIQQ